MRHEVSIVEAAMLTGRSEYTIQQWIESGRLKIRQITPHRCAIKVADLYNVIEQDMQDRTALLSRIEALEEVQEQHQAHIQESERQLDSLFLGPRPDFSTRTPSSQQKPQEPDHIHQTPNGLPFGSVPLNQFAEAHSISYDMLQEQLCSGELDATSTPYGKHTQYWLSSEQQEKLIQKWNKTGMKYTMCQMCPHRSSI